MDSSFGKLALLRRLHLAQSLVQLRPVIIYDSVKFAVMVMFQTSIVSLCPFKLGANFAASHTYRELKTVKPVSVRAFECRFHSACMKPSPNDNAPRGTLLNVTDYLHKMCMTLYAPVR